ncbi:hypothetical protein SDRG_16590 [Saprolegnia diclina VS20]|uniref:Glutathione S-transferase n=1 Tax=Saprolegnia diclina (strain VS20) TaxID=1156394 RepID=T0R0N6_SAPDV|nr:hypothetical protein SDRG_16590 [Saprolegnia diclina VS20]EQC25533.1 hypothetical protein SDRG_16590 [Saprolegnia diclina VS20]|eukprot:XP_008621028.1 hypothetical protein SDRG_16590 [Saprolegnia diclina VS20]
MPATQLTTVAYTSLSDAELDALKTDGKVHLFNNIGCPFGHRALWTAAEVDAPLTVYEIGLYAGMPPSYVEKFNRYHTVPFLVHEGYPVYESAIVAQFLDTKYNDGKLHNRDSPERAALAQLAQAKFEAGPFYALLRNQDPAKKDKLEANLRDSLGELEKIYRDHAADFRADGPYLLGADLSSAEINIVPFLFRFKHVLGHYRDFDVTKGFPLLTAAYEAAIARPAFKLTVRDPEYYINAYAKYANP